MSQQIFREDLYWRLNVISIDVPPLRERKEDIPQLVANFIERYNERLGKNVNSFSNEAMDLIFSHHWPGNVRELENVVERSVLLAKEDLITPDLLTPELRAQDSRASGSYQVASLDRLERDHVRSVLERCAWNKYKAAKLMGISRSTLYSKMRKHGLADAG
jgi:transcriptional regulator with PAS, ATPase and Fis domain